MIQVDDDEVKEPEVKVKEFDVDDLEEVKTGKKEVKKGGKEVTSTIPTCLQHELHNLNMFYNLMLPHLGNVALMMSVDSGIGDPENYNEALNHDDPGKRKK